MHRWILGVIAIAALPLFATHLNAKGKSTVSETRGGEKAEKAIYLWPVKPPEGWFHNLEVSRKVGVQIMTPRPTDSDAIIYVQASLKEEDRQAEIAESQEKLRQSDSRTKIIKLPEVARNNGQAAFQLYRYEIPSQPRQPLEYVAFGGARFVDGKFFDLAVTLSGHDPRAVEKYGEIFRAFLAAH